MAATDRPGKNKDDAGDMEMKGWRWALKYNTDQPRVPAGSSDGGRWTSGNMTSSWKPDTDNPDEYHPFVKGIYESLPPATRDGIPTPRVVIDEGGDDPRMQFASIRMGLSGLEPNPHTGKVSRQAEQRIGSVFVHEYAHYVDYHTNISQSPEFQAVFEASAKRADAASKAIGPGWDLSQKQLREATESVGGNVDYPNYPKEYWSSPGRRQQELFAIGMSAWEYYHPSFWKQFPELKSYYRENFPHPGGD